MDITKITRSARKVLRLKYCGAVIVAAGSASRMGGIDKVMAQLNGEPMIARTVRNFQECDAVGEIVIVTREDLVMPIMELTAEIEKVTAVVVGGASRQESVAMGLGAVNGALFLLGFVLLQSNMKRNGVVLSSIFMKLGLLVPMVISIFLFREIPAPMQIAGGILILGGVLYYSRLEQNG